MYPAPVRKPVLTLAMVSGIFCTLSFAPLRASENSHQAPKATPEEAKIRHWQVPEIDRNFWDIPELENAYIDASPADKGDGIAVGKLGVDGGDKALILALAKEIANKQHAEVDSLLIAQKGKVLFESYYSRGRVDLSHPQSSTTKSYTALAIGRAIQLGHLSMADLNRPLVSFLKGLDPSRFAKGVDKITLHQAMAMKSGLQLSPEKVEAYRKNPDLFQGVKLVQAFLEDTAPITPDSQTFNYQGQNPDMVMQVLDAVVPGTAHEFIKTELFDKMGIVNYDWRTDDSGLPNAGSSSSMTSRNMVKLGTLVMNHGKWKGEQLVSQAFLDKATQSNIQLTQEQVENFYSGDLISNSGYGYFWWPADMKVGNKTYFSTSAQGGGGVVILLVAELDLVVVVTAHARQAYLQMIAEKVLPAFI